MDVVNKNIGTGTSFSQHWVVEYMHSGLEVQVQDGSKYWLQYYTSF